jgi:hypothetical protein
MISGSTLEREVRRRGSITVKPFRAHDILIVPSVHRRIDRLPASIEYCSQRRASA